MSITRTRIATAGLLTILAAGPVLPSLAAGPDVAAGAAYDLVIGGMT